jgi:hypothetical protein
MPEADEHLPFIAVALVTGSVTPFIGAGVNRCGRPEGGKPQRGRYLPDGSELARSIARRWQLTDETVDPTQLTAEIARALGVPVASFDLLRISQYVSLMSPDEKELEGFLHEVFDAPYPATRVHTLLAGLPARLRENGLPANDQLIVTANYDDTLERAFDEAGEPFDLVVYHRGDFLHWPRGADRAVDEPVMIKEPQSYTAIDDEEGTIILKVHGSVHEKSQSFVITEDDYIDYLTRTDVNKLLPVNIVNRLKRSSFLFLGYSLRDWNIRAILHALSHEQRRSGIEKQHWAVLLNPDQIEQKLWERRKVRLVEIPLDEFVEKLDVRIERSVALEREELQPEQAL